MNDDQFKKIDEEITQIMQKISRRRVPREILKDFSLSVSEKIRERENQKISGAAKRFSLTLRVLMPALAVFLLFFTLVFRTPSLMEMGTPFMYRTTAEISDEMAALRAVGGWSDEDDKSIVSDENALEEIEMSA